MNHLTLPNRLLRGSVLLLLLLFGFVSVVNADSLQVETMQTSSTGTVNTGALNVRSGPSVAYSVSAVIYQGNSVTLLGRNDAGSWLQIQTPAGTTGWVNASLITTETAVSSLPVVATPTLAASAVVATGALNVRSGPGVNYSVLTAVSYGDSLSLLGRVSNNSWVKVQLGSGQQGWVNTGLISANVTISSLPIVDSPAEPEPAVPVAPNALLALRSGPSLNDTVVGHVFQGQRVKALARNDNSSWIKVRIIESGIEGWISATNVQLSVSLDSLPIQFGSETVSPPTTSPTGLTAVVATGALNMRTGPGAAYAITTVVNQNDSLTITGRISSNSWIQVTTPGGQSGWVSTALVNISGDLSSAPVVDVPSQTATAYVNTGALNVRSGPGVAYDVTAVVQLGETVGLIGRTSDSSWVKVRLTNNHVGWLNATYIVANTTINSLPVTD
ncbi:MAG: SH3 domain-containing protein [Chloroflexota bacterium]